MLNSKTLKHSMIALSAACTIATGAFGLTAVTTRPASAQTATPRMDQAMRKHPKIREAQGKLREALALLQSSDRDFKGHRDQAISLTNQAIAACDAALQDTGNH